MARLISKSIQDVFREKNYRLFFYGMCVSVSGVWMTRTAIAWMAFESTRSTLFLGLLACCAQLPTFLIAPLAGVLADRVPKRRILLCTQTACAVTTSLMAWADAADRATPHVLVIYALSQSIIDGFDMTARQSFLLDIVGQKRNLAPGIAVNSMVYNVLRMVSPPLAGLMIAGIGAFSCFALDSVSYFVALVMLVRMTGLPARKPKSVKRLHHEILDGLRCIAKEPPLRFALLSALLAGVLGMSFTTILPKVAVDVLAGGPRTLGLLYSFLGAGAIGGGLWMARHKGTARFAAVIRNGGLFGGACIFLFGFVNQLAFALALLFGAGFGFLLQMGLSSTLLQIATPEGFRGRISSLYAMTLMGAYPLGGLLLGWTIHCLGFHAASWIFGGSLILLLLVLYASHAPLAVPEMDKGGEAKPAYAAEILT